MSAEFVEEQLQFMASFIGIIAAFVCALIATRDWRASRRPGAPNGDRRVVTGAMWRKQWYLFGAQVLLLNRASYVISEANPLGELSPWGQSVRWGMAIVPLLILCANVALLRMRGKLRRA